MITLTDAAAIKVKQLIFAENDEGLGLRVEVGPGGCSGFSYNMFFDSEVKSDDVTSEQGGVRIIVDPESAEKLTGATLDYKDGLDESGFSITNPSASHSCGCGKSFT
ncbi:MAG: iron-sulfur cluster insertion protein ErpA [Microthrixaceae bacterium]|nr:iron-sulfur cluster insertion protein ErpA [Microthrixaceae bacterium]